MAAPFPSYTLLLTFPHAAALVMAPARPQRCVRDSGRRSTAAANLFSSKRPSRHPLPVYEYLVRQ